MSYPGPMIIRIARGAEPDVYLNNDYEFQIGKSITVQEGKDLTLIGTGSSVYWSLMAAKELEQSGIKARVIDMHTIKPFDTDAVLRAALETGCVVTVEDQSINGALAAPWPRLLRRRALPASLSESACPTSLPFSASPTKCTNITGWTSGDRPDREKLVITKGVAQRVMPAVFPNPCSGWKKGWIMYGQRNFPG